MSAAGPPPDDAEQRRQWCADLDEALAILTQQAQAHRDGLVAAATRARAHRDGMQTALDTHQGLLDMVGTGRETGGDFSRITGISAIFGINILGDLAEQIQTHTAGLIVELQAVALAETDLERVLDEAEPLLDADDVFCGDDAAPPAVADITPGPDDIVTPLGLPIPAGLGWTDGWNLNIPGTLSMPWVDDPAHRSMDSRIVVTIRDTGAVILARLSVPFGGTRCETASIGIPGFSFSGFYEDHYIVDGSIELTGPRTRDNQYPVRITATVTHQGRQGDAWVTDGTGSFEGEGMLIRVGNLSQHTEVCE